MDQVHLSGDQGLKFEVTGGQDYVCDDTFRAVQGRARDGTQFGVTIWDAGGGSWTGGLIDSLLTKGDSWEFCKKIDGVGLRIRGGPFTVRGAKIILAEDSVRFQFGGDRLAGINGCWFIDTRDEIEADGRPSHIRIQRSYLDNIHTIVSTRRGSKSRDGNPPPVLIEITDTVITFAEDHFDPRTKRDEVWNPTNHGHGQWFKTESVTGEKKGARDTLLIRNTVVAEWRLPKQSKSNTRWCKPGTVIHPGSGGNLYVWLGPQDSAGNGGIKMVTVEGVSIPEQLGIHLYPGLWDVTDDPAALDDARKRFFDDYWRKPIDDKPPPPPPDQTCEEKLEDALERIAELEEALEEAEIQRDYERGMAIGRRAAIDLAREDLDNAP